jgi:hypothetical protein
MKFSSISTYALLIAFIPDASSFVPNASRLPAGSHLTPVSFNNVISTSLTARPSTELNLFGSRWRKTRRLNSQSNPDKAPITESEVRGLFELWNSALATGDSRIVASRYTKVRFYLFMFRCWLHFMTISFTIAFTNCVWLQSPVLLPTVSDQPRTNYDAVRDYFDTFLLRKPQGVLRIFLTAFSNCP